ncbi:hypothetical protein AK88_05437 [Plasmodium fragile]|uniref:Schizont-infected cell agglutination C-terminal domain-containing protein n=1 Tax=Plasmodium fragile TaxID=5857 RepID=A0A0D9QD36_PLAFR|nr:uncharacterized protein AK88_05437 [Plasmodium fragile]KJP84928.1 hypothetical protein AK88_05437 [Plasmodium fragile]
MQGLLREFVDYMAEMEQHGLLESLGANCENPGWKYKHGDNTLFTSYSQKAKMTCKIMSTALAFMGTVRQGRGVEVTRNENEGDIRQILGCVVVHVFESILSNSQCGDTWKGINYAWEAMKQVDVGYVLAPGAGALATGRCEHSGWKGSTIGSGNIRTAVHEWLSKHTDLRTKLREMHGNENCTAQKGTGNALAKTTGNVDPGARVIGSGGIGNEIVTVVKEVFEEMKDEVIEKSKSSPAIPGAEKATSTTADAPTPGANVARKDSEDDEPPARPPPPPKPQNGNDQGAPGQGAAGSGGPGPVPQPPPVAPPPAEGSEKAGKDKSKPTCPAAGGSHTRHVGEGILSVSVSFVPSSDPKDCSGSNSPEPPACSTPLDSKVHPWGPYAIVGTGTEKDSSSNGGPGATSTEAPAPPATPTTAPSPTPGTHGAAAGTADGTIQSTIADVTPKNKGHDPPSAPSPADSVVDGGKDDPPPLNPPKPKPNPNPDQSGSSGSFSDADMADGVSGGQAQGSGGEPDDQVTSTPGGGGLGQPAAEAAGPSPTTVNSVPDSSQAGSHPPSGPGQIVDSGTEVTLVPSTNPTSSPTGPGLTVTQPDTSSGKANEGGKAPTLRDRASSSGGSTLSEQQPTPSSRKPFDPKDLVPYTPVIIPAVVGIGVIAFFLWKYFAYLAKRRRTYRTIRDVPSPPLDEEILDHLQRGELPPPDYGYTMVKDRQPASTSGRARPPRVHRRTIIELHLEVLNACEATEWENVKDDYWQILVEQFMRHGNGHSSSLDAPTTNQALPGNHVPSTESDGIDPCPPHDPDPWCCMETIQLATDTSPPNEEHPDPWSCMENIQLDAEQRRTHCDHGDATSDGTQWITWIDRNKHIVRACTTQPWFNALKSEWKQYLREHMVATDDNVHRELREQGSIGCVEMKKDAWKQWVAKQHHDMAKYIEKEWFQHLLNNVEQATVPATGEVLGVEKDLEVETVTAAAHVLRVRDLPWSQPLHPQPYMKKPLTAKTWILILALVIEDCELESRLQENELYVDDLLHNMRH